MRGRAYDEISVGDSACFDKTITDADILGFSAITGDINPIHTDETYATTSSLGRKLGGRIAQGMLSAALFSTLVGMHIPGKGALYVSQSCQFLKPVKIGDRLRVEARVVEKMPKGRIRLRTTITNQRGELAVDGEAVAIAARHQEDVV